MIVMDFACIETPEMIQKQEDWVNRTLRDLYQGATVCLHADRTTTTECGDVPGQCTVRVECDYCPAFVVTPSGCTVHLAPWYFTAGPAVL